MYVLVRYAAKVTSSRKPVDVARTAKPSVHTLSPPWTSETVRAQLLVTGYERSTGALYINWSS